MSEIRQDPLTGRCVIIARDRANRPHAFVDNAATLDDSECPFCLGYEQQTPQPIAVYAPEHPSGAEPWWVRVVPNKYPAVLDVCSSRAAATVQLPAVAKFRSQGFNAPSGPCDFFHTDSAIGTHEVIIESTRHVESITELDESIATLLFRVYRDRLRALRSAGQVRYVLAFKNVGAAAGASLAHSHSQLLATPFVPPQVELELAHFHRYHQSHSRCILCDLMQDELAAGDRVVATTPRFIAWCPFASRCPYEICVAPRTHAHHYDAATDHELIELALLVRDLVRRMEATHPQIAYNYLIHTSPCDATADEPYHWHLELLPRLIRFAGFEWGAGCYINPIPPEMAAANLRSVCN